MKLTTSLALDARVGEQRLLVAELQLAEVLLDHALDDVLVDRADR